MSLGNELDIGPLTWVKGEIDLALERAAEALARHGEEGAEAKHLKSARTYLHQANGAVSIVGLDGVTRFSEALEGLLQAVEEGRVAFSPGVAEAAAQGIVAIRRYLDDLIGGQPNQPLRLLPAYRALAAAQGQGEPAPTDLFFPDLSLRPPRRERDPAALGPAEFAARAKAARLGFQRGLLKWLKNDPRGVKEMRGSVAIIEMTQSQPAARAFWWAALAFLDSVAAGSLELDGGARKMCARIETQIKKLLDGSRTVAERLMRDTLYYVAIAGPSTDHVACVKAAYRLDELIPKPAAEADIEPLRPILRVCREQLALAMDDWNRFCAGTAAALPQFHDRYRQVAERAGELRHTDLSRLAGLIGGAADALRRAPLIHNETIALEMATALLLFDNALDGFQRLGDEFAVQVATIGNRLDAALHNEPLATMALPQLDEMSRRAQEKLLLSQVAREILASLGVIEQALDAFFRDTTKSADLAGLSKPLKQVEGALTVLGQERAAAVLRECEGVIAGFGQEGREARQGDFEEVAGKLSALGFFVEKLQYGPADIDAFLGKPRTAPAEAPPPATTTETELEDAKRLTTTLIGALRAQPEDTALRGEIRQSLEAVRENAELVDDSALAEQASAALFALETEQPSPQIEEAVAPIAPAPLPATPPSAEASRLAEASGEEIDAELLGIFIEEAHEVLATIEAQLPIIAGQPHDREALTTVRRAFHTLKGSGRMVGLAELGEAAWAVEQVLNRWLQLEQEATPALQAMLADAHRLFSAWATQLEAGGSVHHDASELAGTCATLKGEAPPPPAPPVEEALAPEALPAETLVEVEEQFPDLAADFNLDFPPETPVEAVEPPLELDFDLGGDLTPAPVPVPEAAPEPLPEIVVVEEVPPVPEDIRIGDVVLSPTLFELFTAEAQGHVATLVRELGIAGVPRRELIRAAHTLAGISATTGFAAVNQLAHALENALNRLARAERGPDDGEHMLLARTVGALEGMVGALGSLRLPAQEEGLTAELDALALAAPVEPVPEIPPEPVLPVPEISVLPEPEVLEPEIAVAEVIEPVAAEPEVAEPEVLEPEVLEPEVLEPEVAEPEVIEPQATEPEAAPAEAVAIPPPSVPPVIATAVPPAPRTEDEPERRQLRMADEIDTQLLPIFLEESVELMHEIGSGLRAWRASPDDAGYPERLKRVLHTFKGSARMTGAMGLGELVHAMESRIEQAMAAHAITPTFLDGLDGSFDRVSMLMEALQGGEAPPAEEKAPLPATPTAAETPVPSPAPVAEAPAPQPAAAAPVVPPPAAKPAPPPVEPRHHTPEADAHAMLRVRADIVDKLVNEAGEIAIARGRIEGEMRSLKGALLELTENVIRLRNQLREIEIQAESQMQSKQALAAEQEAQFDPLEFDRFTRFQELTRMMAESVNDVATSQHTLLQNLDHADAALVAQARLSREHSQALMNVRMVPFNTLADRLYRIVRQTAKELGKRANLDLRGGQTELDRSVLEKMTGPIEHLLRNSIAHGLEAPERRLAAGKPEIGEISIRVTHEGNEIAIVVADDGGGLDFARIRAKAVAKGLLAADEAVSEEHLTQLIFQAGFSTAETVTAVSGRGVGMDVVKSETANLGGRIGAESETGKGTRFVIHLPLTLAVTQAVLVRSGSHHYAIPSSMVAQVRELRPEAIEAVRKEGSAEFLGDRYPWRFLPALLGNPAASPEPARRHWLILLRVGVQRLALEVDHLLGNQEFVVKNIGPQLSRVVGIAGATVLGDGEIVLILNPVALAGREAPAATQEAGAPVEAAQPVEPAAPALPATAGGSVMIVDDSLTVRKITSRLLAREGYHVLMAKDGVDALEQLLDIRPDVMLVDIEMPRMDGFDLTRHVRADERLRDVPIIMITSRIADKHRLYAQELGVNHYLGKPYDEDELLGLIAGYVRKAT